MDIWTAERATSDDPFSPLVPVDELNTSEPQWDAFPTRDGLRLYWTTGEQTNVNLHYADRDTRDDPFGAATVVDVDAPDAYEDSPVLTANDLVFLFGSTRPGGPGGHDLWFAKRATTGDAFGVPQLLPGVNGASREGELAVSPDACELLFASDRDGTGGWDLYATRLVAP